MIYLFYTSKQAGEAIYDVITLYAGSQKKGSWGK